MDAVSTPNLESVARCLTMGLAEVKHSDITKALSERKWGSNKTYNNYLSVIKSVFKLALNDELIGMDPTRNIKALKYVSKLPDPFSLGEVEQILAYMCEHYPEDVWNYYQFMFFTGLRTGEGIAVDWPVIDLDNKTMQVTKAFVIDEMTGTKTQAGNALCC